VSRRDYVESRAATYFMQCRGLELRGTVLAIGQRAGSLQRLRPDLSWILADSAEDLEAIQVPERGFDTIVCIDVLQYEVQPISLLKRLGRLLSEDGEAYVIAPNFGRDDRNELWGFRPEGLRLLAVEAGLRVVESIGINSPWGGMVLAYLSDYATGDPAVGPVPAEFLAWAMRMDEIFVASTILIAARGEVSW
jgi:SAM-dependent methyltransferase